MKRKSRLAGAGSDLGVFLARRRAHATWGGDSGSAVKRA